MATTSWTQADLLALVDAWPTPPNAVVCVDCQPRRARLTLWCDGQPGCGALPRISRWMSRDWPLTHATALLDAMAAQVEIRRGHKEYSEPLKARLSEAGKDFDGWVTRWCMERDGWTDAAAKGCAFKPPSMMWCGIAFAMSAMGLILPIRKEKQEP